MRVRMTTTYGPLTIQVPFGGWATQYSADGQHTIAGIGLHVYTGFNTFTVTVQNGVVIGFSIYIYNGGEGIEAPAPSFSGSFSCTVNGISPPFVNNTTTFPQTITYTSPADGPPPVTVNITASVSGNVYTQSASASYSLTYGLYAQTANLVFSSYDPSINLKLVFLEPMTPSNNGKLIAVKDKSFKSGSMYTAIYAPPGTPIEGTAIPNNEAAILAIDGQCNTYVIDQPNNTYRIANIYPRTSQPTLPTINPTGLSAVSATSDVVDIFSVDSGITPNRTTSNNLVQLPLISNPINTGLIKIIIYAGKNSAKYTGNVLAIQETSGGALIDNYYTSTIKPYIQTDSSADANQKNTGIVFISNENQWFVLGYYVTAPWTWLLTPPNPATKIIPNNVLQFDLISPNANDVVQPPTVQSLNLVKTQTVSGSPIYILFTNQLNGSSYNEQAQQIYYDNPTNSTTWIISYSLGGGAFKNYIALAYTPN
jgi:hypothetical protein